MDKAIIHANRITISARVKLTPITDCIGSKLALQFRNFGRREQVEIYRRFAPFPTSRGMTGGVFEGYCQQKFQEKISLECIPMVRLPDPKPARAASAKKTKVPDGAIDGNQAPKHQWHSSHAVLANGKLEERRLLAPRDKFSFEICPSSTHEYREDDMERFEASSDVYYLPRKSNQVALDSFIIHDGLLYIFQFPRGKHHDIKDGLITFLEKCAGLLPCGDWRVVFIIPDDSDLLKCLKQRAPKLQKLLLFSSMVALEDE